MELPGCGCRRSAGVIDDVPSVGGSSRGRRACAWQCSGLVRANAPTPGGTQLQTWVIPSNKLDAP